jgi:NADPH:quinone reductase-like Zn-dependent oxidoreductase/NAD(P)-dependent dehydrogenase (short-subunit alcohol dehydrogenase family)/SAM-dependent methyltransferase
MLAEFEAAAARVTYSNQRIPIYSNLLGRRAAAGEMSNAAYWTRHLREPVRFADGFASAIQDGFTTFLEVGPHTVLLGLGRQCFPDNPGSWLPSLRRGYDDWTILLDAVAQLYVRGAPIDWKAFDADYGRHRLALPTYPFERQRYWAAPGKPRKTSSIGRRGDTHPLLGRRVTSPFIDERIFESELSQDAIAWLTDHRVLGTAVLPTTAYLELAWAAAVAIHGDAVSAIETIDIFDALVIPDAGGTTMQLAVSPEIGSSASFRIASAPASGGGENASAWRSHASGTIVRDATHAAPDANLAAIRARCAQAIAPSRLRDALSARGIDLGSRFQGLSEVARGDGEAIGRLAAPQDLQDDLAGYRIHPALLDAALQVVTAALFREEELDRSRDTYMPVSVERYRLLTTPARELWSHVVIRSAAMTAPIADLRLYDDGGRLVAEIEGLRLRRVEAAAWASAPRQSGMDLYEITWQPAASDPVEKPAALWSAPAAAAIDEAVEPAVERLVAEHRLREYGTSASDLDAISRDFIIDALNALGWLPQVGARIDEMQLRAQLGIVARYDRLFGRFLEILAEDGFLLRDGSAWIVSRWLVSSEPVRRIDAIRRAHPDAAAELGLVERTGPRLADVLTGRVDSLSLLFPGGQFHEADQLYRTSPSARVLNGLAVEAVKAVVASAPSDAPLRVLEIGGGTGGTSSFVLPVLPADRTRYVFTDLSPLFLARAEEGFRDYPFVEYKLLDIERDPAAQGMRAETFDLVIAANVLHATRDIGETLANVRSLLRPGGSLLLLEGTRPTRWIDVTFGLTDGWWRFTDESLRPRYPLIDRQSWATALERAGFDAPAALPHETGDATLDANLLIAARATGEAPRRQRWLVFADGVGVGETIATQLRESGQDVALAYVGDRFERAGSEFSIPADDADAYRRVIDEMTAPDAPALAGVLHTWSLDAEVRDDASLDEVHASLDRGCRSVLHLAQAMATTPAATGSRLAIVTRGAQAVGTDASSPIHATIWGLASTIRLEHPDLDCACIDLDPAAAALPDDLLARIVERGEPRLGFREGVWRAARLTRRAEAESSSHGAERLINTTPGVLDGLRFVPDEERSPGDGEIMIRVEHSAMNFRDVLIALNMYPGAASLDRLGGECAGEIVAVGNGVRDLRVGDVVAAMAPGGFGSYAVTRAELAMRRPTPMTLEEAATLPSVFATAWHALYDLAGLSRGETVLIHAGAGGVGLAAIQLAQRVGAVVLATAGSPEKRAYLHSIGVEHVMDSRSTAYTAEIGRITGGRGVDVVLNSLADDHIRRSVGVVASGGRFIELGKRGIWTPEQVRAMRPTVRYFVVDLAAVADERPAVIGELMRKITAAAEAREIRSLPVTSFSSSDIDSAYRYMAQARHIGKIVVHRAPAPRATTIRGDATYLITGGLGGLGLAMAERLVERGAGHVVLMSRRDASPEIRATLDGWNAAGARVSIQVGDVSRPADVERVLLQIRESLPPLRGVIHSAGSLHDGVLAGQTWEHFVGTFAAKVDGTWNLQRLTRDVPLDFFVLFSSISSLFGSPGQGNHAAANAFMDSLAHHRRSRGERASSINWGAWSETGAAVAHDVSTRLDAQGMGSIATRDGVDLFERLLASDPVQVAPMSADWSVFSHAFAGGQLRRSLLQRLVDEVPARTRAAVRAEVAPPASRQSIRDAATATRWDQLLESIRALATRVLGLEPPAVLDANRPLQELGLDSLMAVELRNRMKAELDLERAPAATIVFDYPTVSALAEYVGRELFAWEPRGASSTATRTSPEATPAATDLGSYDGDSMDLLDRLESLSPAEVDALLAKRMNGGSTVE